LIHSSRCHVLLRALAGAAAVGLPILSLAGGPSSGGGHFGAGGGHTSSASHAAAPHFAAPNFANHPGGGGGYANNGYHGVANIARPVPTGSTYAPANRYVAPYGRSAPAYNNARSYAGNRAIAPGRYIPGRAFSYSRWHGGYWRGGYWPAIYWGSSYAWFLPAIPAFAAAYWWNSVPYYYYNNVYYTYDPTENGYVVTTPPPADESGGPPDSNDTGQGESNPAASDAQPGDAPANIGTASSSMGQLFAYPKNGQSDEQQGTDRQQCAQWASGQASADGTGTSADYQRALTACLQGRGYSVD
jgi:hypothetical protein